MKTKNSLWLRAGFMLFALSVVGSTVAVFSQASFEPGTKERCTELGNLLSSNQYTSADKEEYSKYCGQLPPMAPANQSTSCDDLKKIIDGGQYTADQKAQWANCPQGLPQDSTEPRLYTCDDLKTLIESGGYTAYEKEQWANCERGKDDTPLTAPAYTCDELKKIIDSGNYDSDQKQLWLNCQQGYKPVPRETSANRCDELKKIMASGTYNAEQKQAYLKCQGRAGETDSSIGDQAKRQCEDLRAKLEKLSAEPNSQDYADTKAEYVKMCYSREQEMRTQEGNDSPRKLSNFVPENQECKDLRAKIGAYNKEGLANTEDYANLKNTFKKKCEKANAVPPAGYEDEVLVNVDAYNNPFPDTDANGREGKAAAELYRRGVLGGFPDGEFKGDKPVNRAEAAKFLLLACGKDTQADYSGKFRDLMKGQWYVPYVEAAARLGIINGYADGNFRPANTVNRAEFSKMITLACQLPTDLDHSLFTDVTSEDWFATYAGAVQKYSLYPDSAVDNLFKPANLMTRSEVAIAIYQYLTNR
ncbi:S-layer homology domain-containing protein [Candidatus Peregrinibacteria bacterium]|nr:S-layer homology domain-containing protein [Candidatus Peregrinibacteria bacterium]